MGKYKRKVKIISPYNTGAFEGYLSSMASTGFFLSEITLDRYCFEPGEPEEMEYRVEYSEDGYSQEKIDFYEESGWHFVVHYQSLYVYCCRREEMTCELNTDPVEQSLSLQNSVRELRKTMIWYILLFLGVIVGFLLFLYFTSGERTPTLFFLEFGVWMSVLFLIPMWSSLHTSIQYATQLSSVKKLLASGEPIDHHGNWKRQQTSFWRGRALYLLLSPVIVLFLMNLSFMKNKDFTSYEDAPAQFLTLDDFTNIYGLPEAAASEAVEKLFYGTQQKNLFLSRISISDARMETGSDVPVVSIEIESYQVHIPFFTNYVMKDLITLHTTLLNPEKKYELTKLDSSQYNTAKYDEVYICTQNNLIFTKSGNRVTCYCYNGEIGDDTAILQ